jgi:hypothetical protein
MSLTAKVPELVKVWIVYPPLYVMVPPVAVNASLGAGFVPAKLPRALLASVALPSVVRLMLILG